MDSPWAEAITMTNVTALRTVLFALALSLMSGPVRGQPTPTMSRNLFYQAAFVRESADRQWHFRISGNVPSLAGAYLVAHDVTGRILARHHIPHGRYSDEQPLVFTVPADGVTGDFRIVVVGFQNDVLEINLPLTDLPLEVYGTTFFAARTDKLLFRTLPDQKQLTLSSNVGGMRLWQGDTALIDTAKVAELKERRRVAVVAVQPQTDYRLDPHSTFYFGVDEGVFLTFDLSRWFRPDPRLDEAKWWQEMTP
jgi:hypothetical protein